MVPEHVAGHHEPTGSPHYGLPSEHRRAAWDAPEASARLVDTRRSRRHSLYAHQSATGSFTLPTSFRGPLSARRRPRTATDPTPQPSPAAVPAVPTDTFFPAVKVGDATEVRTFLDHHPDPTTARDAAGLSPLLTAIFWHRAEERWLSRTSGTDLDVLAAAAVGDTDRLETLVAANHELHDAHSPDGWTPLALAAHFGHEPAVRGLLICGADIRARSVHAMGNTPLHAAVAGNPAALATLPLAHGPDADVRKSIGWSSLHLAADTSAEDAVALLLAHGANPRAANGPDRTPLAMALRRGHDTVAALIREADPPQASVRPDRGPSGAAPLVAPASLLRFPTTRPSRRPHIPRELRHVSCDHRCLGHSMRVGARRESTVHGRREAETPSITKRLPVGAMKRHSALTWGIGAALVAAVTSGVIATAGPLAAQAPTPTPITAVLIPLATQTPAARATATVATEETATASPEETTLEFQAADWEGGFYRGDSEYYGRPWVAIYGALSDYPRAELTFHLAAEPEEDVVFTVAGLDDEWEAKNRIAIEVNGRQGYEGESPFVNWDGVGNGEDAAWREIAITIPASFLREGNNEIAILNREPVYSYNGPPYILVAEASVETDDVEVSSASDDETATAATDDGTELTLTVVADDDGGGDDE